MVSWMLLCIFRNMFFFWIFDCQGKLVVFLVLGMDFVCMLSIPNKLLVTFLILKFSRVESPSSILHLYFLDRILDPLDEINVFLDFLLLHLLFGIKLVHLRWDWQRSEIVWSLVIILLRDPCCWNILADVVGRVRNLKQVPGLLFRSLKLPGNCLLAHIVQLEIVLLRWFLSCNNLELLSMFKSLFNLPFDVLMMDLDSVFLVNLLLKFPLEQVCRWRWALSFWSEWRHWVMGHGDWLWRVDRTLS